MAKIITHFTHLKEKEIIKKNVQGESDLFETLMRRHIAALYRVVRCYGFNHEDAEDLMQDTYLTAYKQLAGIEHRVSYKIRIIKILVHKCVYKISFEYFIKELNTGHHPDHSEPICSGQKELHTDSEVINRKYYKVLEKNLHQLPITYSTVFILKEIEGFSIAETAELLNITPLNVTIRLNRAKAIIKCKLANYNSSAKIFEYNLFYADQLVQKILHNIHALNN
jgi:RNA polymerase sigma-70 factor (ECF subfamily)